MSSPLSLPIAIVGVGKIALDQHIPTIAQSDRFHLVGAVSRHGKDLDVPVRSSLADLKSAVPELAAIAVCTPPVGRLTLLEEAFSLGLHVLMEKPPAKTVAEAEQFARAAAGTDQVLYQSWHSRCAASVEPLRQWLSQRTIRRARIRWLEDVRVWHPGQEWIWSPGIGVFDPGINALSILTEIMPTSLAVQSSVLSYPANRPAPIAAEIAITGASGIDVDVQFSFDQKGPQSWTIDIETDEGTGTLLDGGARWTIDGVEQPILDARGEYARVYDRFATLIDEGRSDVDLTPFRLVADAFLLGQRRETQAFHWNA